MVVIDDANGHDNIIIRMNMMPMMIITMITVLVIVMFTLAINIY